MPRPAASNRAGQIQSAGATSQRSLNDGTWTEQEPRIAPARLTLTDRAGRWVTFQVGKHGGTVNELASEVGCDWHTVNDAVIAYSTALRRSRCLRLCRLWR